jgi:hypothetical protein
LPMSSGFILTYDDFWIYIVSFLRFCFGCFRVALHVTEFYHVSIEVSLPRTKRGFTKICLMFLHKI